MKSPLAIGLLFAAGLIPISILIGLSPMKAVLLSVAMGALFLGLVKGMSRVLKK